MRNNFTRTRSSQPKSESLKFRLAPDDLEYIKDRAYELDITVADLMRYLAIDLLPHLDFSCPNSPKVVIGENENIKFVEKY